jgi:hypothetical protein
MRSGHGSRSTAVASISRYFPERFSTVSNEAIRACISRPAAAGSSARRQSRTVALAAGLANDTLVLDDLVLGERPRIIAARVSAIPRRDPLERPLERHPGAPAQERPGLAGVQPQLPGLVRAAYTPKSAAWRAATQATGRASSSAGPKFQAEPKLAPSVTRRSATVR